MDFHIRKAEVADYQMIALLVKQVHELHVHERPDIYSPDHCPMGKDYFNKLLKDEHSTVFVVEDFKENNVIAHTIIRINSTPHRQIFRQRKYINIDDLCVDKDYRGQGIGKQIMKYLEKYSQEIGAGCIELGVSEFNREAISFYESLGMKTRSRRMELFIE